MERCVYCLSEKISVCICADCKSRLERAEQDLQHLKKMGEFRQQQNWKKLNEYKRNLRRGK
jgi:predicted nucleotide-binding protein (sugar kinase/HSP70/actin superfamily)